MRTLQLLQLLFTFSTFGQYVLMTDEKGVPTTPIDPVGFRQALQIDTDTSHTTLLPSAPVENGKVPISANGTWVVGVVSSGGGELKILATSPLAKSTDANGNTVLSVTPVWLTPNAATELFAALNHNQPISTINGLQAALDTKAPLHHTQDWSTLTGTPTTYPPSAHTQEIATISGLQTALDAKANAIHTQDWSTLTGTPTTYPPSTHTQEIATISGLQTALDAKANAIHTQDWSTLTGTPTTYPPSAHTQEIATISGLQTALDAKANAQHTHDAGQIESGVLDPARVPGLDAGKVVSGVFAMERIPPLDATNVASGVFAPARIPSLSYELPLGNPAADGLVLASTAKGERSWIAPLTGAGAAGTLAKFTAGGALGDSVIREVDGKVGIGLEPATAFEVRGDLGTREGTLYANGPLQVSAHATIGGSLTVGAALAANRSAESAFRGQYAAADNTPGATRDVQVRDAAGTGTLTLHFKNGLFTGATTP
jgi:hypothetical protein